MHAACPALRMASSSSEDCLYWNALPLWAIKANPTTAILTIHSQLSYRNQSLSTSLPSPTSTMVRIISLVAALALLCLTSAMTMPMSTDFKDCGRKQSDRLKGCFKRTFRPRWRPSKDQLKCVGEVSKEITKCALDAAGDKVENLSPEECALACALAGTACSAACAFIVFPPGLALCVGACGATAATCSFKC